MKKSRLKKVALMPSSTFENSLDQMSDKGRAILKAIEDYKFTIDQTLRIVKNDQQLTGLITQKKKNLDHAAQDVYNIVFEIENVDITSAYNNQQPPDASGGSVSIPPSAPGGNGPQGGPPTPSTPSPATPQPSGQAPTPPGPNPGQADGQPPAQQSAPDKSEEVEEDDLDTEDEKEEEMPVPDKK